MLTFYICRLKTTDCPYFTFSKNAILWETQMLPIFVGWWKFFKNCVRKWKRSDGRLYCFKFHFHTIRITNFRLFPKFAFSAQASVLMTPSSVLKWKYFVGVQNLEDSFGHCKHYFGKNWSRSLLYALKVGNSSSNHIWGSWRNVTFLAIK